MVRRLLGKRRPLLREEFTLMAEFGGVGRGLAMMYWCPGLDGQVEGILR